MSYKVRGYSWRQDARGATALKSDKAYKSDDPRHRGSKEDVSVCLNCTKEDCKGKCAAIDGARK